MKKVFVLILAAAFNFSCTKDVIVDVIDKIEDEKVELIFIPEISADVSFDVEDVHAKHSFQRSIRYEIRYGDSVKTGTILEGEQAKVIVPRHTSVSYAFVCASENEVDLFSKNEQYPGAANEFEMHDFKNMSEVFICTAYCLDVTDEPFKIILKRMKSRFKVIERHVDDLLYTKTTIWRTQYYDLFSGPWGFDKISFLNKEYDIFGTGDSKCWGESHQVIVSIDIYLKETNTKLSSIEKRYSIPYNTYRTIYYDIDVDKDKLTTSTAQIDFSEMHKDEVNTNFVVQLKAETTKL